MREKITGPEEFEPGARVREFTKGHPYEGNADASRRMAVEAARAVCRVDELIEGGVIPERDRREAERNFIGLYSTAATGTGTAQDERIVRAAIRPAPSPTTAPRSLLDRSVTHRGQPPRAAESGMVDEK